MHIICSIIVSFVVGVIARSIMPFGEAIGFWITDIVSMVGSVIGGLIARLFNKLAPGTPFQQAGFLLSIVGAIILLFVLRHS